MSFAEVMVEDSQSGWGFWVSPNSTLGAVGIVVGALFLMTIAIFFWAAFVRKPRHRIRAHDHDGSRRRRRRKEREVQEEETPEKHRRRRRRSHHEKRPLNPTLAQVGGLPPQRQNKPPGP